MEPPWLTRVELPLHIVEVWIGDERVMMSIVYKGWVVKMMMRRWYQMCGTGDLGNAEYVEGWKDK
jgi:hypothetical protein